MAKIPKIVTTTNVIPSTTHVYLLVDTSGSMQGHGTKLVKLVNDQLQNIRESAKANPDEETYISIYGFSAKPYYIGQPGTPYKDIVNISYNDLEQWGSTAIYDTLDLVMSEANKQKHSFEPNTSHLVILLTDGHENSSLKRLEDIQPIIARNIATDRWTVTALVPPGSKDQVTKVLRLSSGNVSEWETTEEGFNKASNSITRGVNNYYSYKSQGVTSIQNFYVDDINLTDNKVSNLLDVSGDFEVWIVDQPKIRIDEFVNKKLATIKNKNLKAKLTPTYRIGYGYYELTKTETLQPTKDFVVQNIATGKMYGGKDARTLLKLPTSGYIKITPGYLNDYRIFVKSTSLNRNLYKDSRLLYKHI